MPPRQQPSSDSSSREPIATSSEPTMSPLSRISGPPFSNLTSFGMLAERNIPRWHRTAVRYALSFRGISERFCYARHPASVRPLRLWDHTSGIDLAGCRRDRERSHHRGGPVSIPLVPVLGNLMGGNASIRAVCCAFHSAIIRPTNKRRAAALAAGRASKQIDLTTDLLAFDVSFTDASERLVDPLFGVSRACAVLADAYRQSCSYFD
jgi:hypothetical protein